MLDDFDDAGLGAFVADLFREAGPAAHVWEHEGQTFVGVEHREDGDVRRALFWTVADDGRSVTARSVRAFADLCEREGVATGTVLAAVPVADDARRTAADCGVGVVDRDGLRALLDDPDVAGLLERRAGDRFAEEGSSRPAGDQGQGTSAGRPVAGSRTVSGSPNAAEDRTAAARARRRGAAGDAGPGGRIERLRELGGRFGPLAGLAVVGVLLLVAVVLGAAIFGFGPVAGGGGTTVAANGSVTANGSVAADAPEAADLRVTWDARSGPVADANASDGLAHPAPNGSTFVVVALEVANAGEDAVPVFQSDFRLTANGTTHGHQPLAGERPFAGGALAPNASTGGAVVFRVPEDAESATLVVSPRLRDGPGVAFERDGSLGFNVSTQPQG